MPQRQNEPAGTGPRPCLRPGLRGCGGIGARLNTHHCARVHSNEVGNRIVARTRGKTKNERGRPDAIKALGACHELFGSFEPESNESDHRQVSRRSAGAFEILDRSPGAAGPSERMCLPSAWEQHVLRQVQDEGRTGPAAPSPLQRGLATRYGCRFGSEIAPRSADARAASSGNSARIGCYQHLFFIRHAGQAGRAIGRRRLQCNAHQSVHNAL